MTTTSFAVNIGRKAIHRQNSYGFIEQWLLPEMA
jgi:hypothetical protein